jgi:hypothetical protein
MSDVNTFIDAIGKDVNAAVVPRIEELAKGIGAKARSDYVPQISVLADRLVKQIIDEQSVVIRDFATAMIQDVFQRYQPELAGELRTRIVNEGIEVVGQGVRLDVKRRDTGAVVSSLDVPVQLKIRIDGVSLTLTETTIGLDVVR